MCLIKALGQPKLLGSETTTASQMTKDFIVELLL